MINYRYLHKRKYLILLKRFLYFVASIALCFLFTTVSVSTTYAHVQRSVALTTNITSANNEAASVKLGGKEILKISAGVGIFSSKKRADEISIRINKLANNKKIKKEKIEITVDEQPQTTNLYFRENLLLTVTDADADASEDYVTRQELAKKNKRLIEESVRQYRNKRSSSYILGGVIKSALSTVVFTGILKLLVVLYPWMYAKLSDLKVSRISAIKIKKNELFTANKISHLLRLTRVSLTAVLVLIYLHCIMSFFPWTESINSSVNKEIKNLLQKVFDYLPKLSFILITIAFTFVLIKIIQAIFTALSSENIAIQGFHEEWVEPTFKISVFFIIILAAVAVFPYLPGYDSPAFKGISIFLGSLVTLGSTAVVANVIAGLIFVYSRAFRVGDRVKIGDSVGDVVDKTLFVTRIRTVKNVIITIPNSSILTSQIINYTAADSDPNQPPLILHTKITLGYDVPWRKVHQVLIDAAKSTANLLSEPKPFVLQNSLDDFYVCYELNVYTNDASKMVSIHSELHQNIQDKCNEAEIEILSPHYSAVRDGSQITIPEDYLPQNYQAPGWRILPEESIVNLLKNNSYNPSESNSKEVKD